VATTIEKSGEAGWALLGLILALTIMSIVLVSATTPNYRAQVQRDKEAEMLYRGQQMAEGIARYYNRGVLGPVALRSAPTYGYLKELSKLKEGVRLGVNEIKFVRPSAMIDPMDSREWEPLYARDPRIMPYLQAWASETGGIISPFYLELASAPVSVKKNNNSESSGTDSKDKQITKKKEPTDIDDDDDDEDDDDDDDSSSVNDPLANIFKSGITGGVPIIGVVPRVKGKSVRSLYGLKNYEEWVFLYIPPNNAPQNQLPQAPQNQNQLRRPQQSQ
jgi:type II secretory pathway pseudopilin PulG